MNAGRKLDALVAEKVMGCEVMPGFSSWTGSVLKDYEITKDGVRCGYLPEYSTDISAAWEVVEKMQDEGWGWTADRRGDGAVPDDFAVAWRFHRRASIARADKPEAPLAICLASLKAKGVDV